MAIQDSNGFLEIKEIKEIFNPENKKNINDKVWMDLIKEIDKNSDGRVIILIIND